MLYMHTAITQFSSITFFTTAMASWRARLTLSKQALSDKQEEISKRVCKNDKFDSIEAYIRHTWLTCHAYTRHTWLACHTWTCHTRLTCHTYLPSLQGKVVVWCVVESNCVGIRIENVDNIVAEQGRDLATLKKNNNICCTKVVLAKLK